MENNFKLREKLLDLMEEISMTHKTETEIKQDNAFHKIVQVIYSCQSSGQ